MAISCLWFPRHPFRWLSPSAFRNHCAARERDWILIFCFSDLLPGTCRFLFGSMELKNTPKNHSANGEQEPSTPSCGGRNVPMVAPVTPVGWEMSPLLWEQDSGSAEGLCEDSPSWWSHPPAGSHFIILRPRKPELGVSSTGDRFLSEV